MKIIIGFTHKTSKILPKIFCRNFRHCAVITENPSRQLVAFTRIRTDAKRRANKEKRTKNKYIMIQVGFGAIKFIPLQKRDLKILEQHGWMFVPLVKGGKFLGEQREPRNLGGLFCNTRTLHDNPPILLNSPHSGSLSKIPPLTRGTTCVGFAKRALGIRRPLIWTPDQLYRHIQVESRK
ncbi:MAG: hypothetical protein FWF97_00840 [Alphaproteobacteria bacterium]|nr:hypothetical protein [Alphaproteobacteria bacterium]